MISHILYNRASQRRIILEAERKLLAASRWTRGGESRKSA